MLDGTEREVLELLIEQPRSPTAVAEELGVSVQTASRNLKRLEKRGYAEQTRKGGGRGYKQYKMNEFASLFAGFGGQLCERTIELTPTHRAILSVLKVPQQEFHSVLLSYLFARVEEYAPPERYEVLAVVVYGSVARGEAKSDSDVDVLVVYGDVDDIDAALNRPAMYGDGWLGMGEERLIMEEPFSLPEFRGALDAGSQFLRNVLDEGIVLYDPEEVIRDARQERAGERLPQ